MTNFSSSSWPLGGFTGTGTTNTGYCILHGAYVGYGCPVCSSTAVPSTSPPPQPPVSYVIYNESLSSYQQQLIETLLEMIDDLRARVKELEDDSAP